MYKERTTKHGDTFFQYVVPKGSDRTNIVRALNEQVLGGHLNNKTETKKADARFYWPGSWSQIKKHCHACAVSKQGIPNRPQLMSIKATRPFELVAFDMIGPITPITNRGSRYILVVTDHCTKWVEAYALVDQTAQRVVELLCTEIICRHGSPTRFLPDQGTNFNADVMEQLAALLYIVKTHATPYRPQCDWINERFNRTLGDMLRMITIDSPADWDKNLKPLCFAYNTAVHTTTGVQPFVMMYGRFPRLPADLIFNTEPVAHELTEGEYAREVCEGLRKVYDVVRKHSAFEVAKQKFFYDRRIKCAVYELNDRVYCRREAPPSKA